MRFPIRPGKVTCAGVVAIMMVLPNSIWKGADANATPRPKVERRGREILSTASGEKTSRSLRKKSDSPRLGVKLREVSR